jgi:hypothetical protein
MTIYGIPGIFNSSLYLAASPGNIKAGFRVFEIYPFNRDIFSDKEFMGLRLQIDLPLLWLHRLPTVTVNPQRRRLILQDQQHALQKKKQVLLPHRTFDLFLKPDPERSECKQEDANNCHFDSYPVKKCFEKNYNARLGATEKKWAQEKRKETRVQHF